MPEAVWSARCLTGLREESIEHGSKVLGFRTATPRKLGVLPDQVLHVDGDRSCAPLCTDISSVAAGRIFFKGERQGTFHPAKRRYKRKKHKIRLCQHRARVYAGSASSRTCPIAVNLRGVSLWSMVCAPSFFRIARATVSMVMLLVVNKTIQSEKCIVLP